MSISTYTGLEAAIASRLHRDDLGGVIPDFISMAETRLGRELRVSWLEKRTTINTVAGTAYYDFPDDYRALRNIRLNTDPVRTLEYLTPVVADKKFSGTATGKPYAYSIIGGQFCFYDTPDAAYEVEVVYFSSPTALSGSEETNAYISNVPDLLLYAALIYAADHTENMQRLEKYSAIYDRLLTEIHVADQNDKWSGSNLRVRAV